MTKHEIRKSIIEFLNTHECYECAVWHDTPRNVAKIFLENYAASIGIDITVDYPMTEEEVVELEKTVADYRDSLIRELQTFGDRRPMHLRKLHEQLKQAEEVLTKVREELRA